MQLTARRAWATIKPVDRERFVYPVSDSGVRLSLDAMATRFELLLPDGERAAGEEAVEEVARIERQLSRFLPGSEVSGLNVRAAKSPVRVDPRLFALLRLSKEVWEKTDGAFDITIAPLMRTWGFTEGQGRVPDDSELAEARQVVGMEHMLLDEETWSVGFDKAGVEIDLGAIGKGYALDRAGRILRDAGVTSALIHAGTSTVLAIGRCGSEPWRIGIRDPSRPGEPPVVHEIQDLSLSVSAVHGRVHTVEGRCYGHVMDPRTGSPTEAAALASAIGPSATLCDALSTALLVLGPAWLPELPHRFPGYHGFTYPKGN
jgi:thiamine biosynthesis lipoprotein